MVTPDPPSAWLVAMLLWPTCTVPFLVVFTSFPLKLFLSRFCLQYYPGERFLLLFIILLFIFNSLIIIIKNKYILNCSAQYCRPVTISLVLLPLCQSCSTATLILSANSFMPQSCVLRGHPEMSSFSRAYTAYTGREGVNVRRVVLMVHRDFEKWSQNQHFQNTVLVERERGHHKKRVLCGRY